MNLEISPTEAVHLAAGLALIAEVQANPGALAGMTSVTRENVAKIKERGQWPSFERNSTLLDKILARLQVEVE